MNQLFFIQFQVKSLFYQSLQRESLTFWGQALDPPVLVNRAFSVGERSTSVDLFVFPTSQWPARARHGWVEAIRKGWDGGSWPVVRERIGGDRRLRRGGEAGAWDQVRARGRCRCLTGAIQGEISPIITYGPPRSALSPAHRASVSAFSCR